MFFWLMFFEFLDVAIVVLFCFVLLLLIHPSVHQANFDVITNQTTCNYLSKDRHSENQDENQQKKVPTPPAEPPPTPAYKRIPGCCSF